MPAEVSEVQIPLLAAVLLYACLAKAVAAARASEADLAGPTATFPLGARRPAVFAVCVVEFALGVGLLATAGPAGAGAPALTVRVGAALLFAVAAGALHVLRSRRPDSSCGCFGDLSRTPVTWRVIARAVLLCAASLSVVGAPPLRMPAATGQACLILAIAAADIAVFCLLSPELAELVLRLSQAEPCEVRAVPVERTLAALHGSGQWRQHQGILVAGTPTDVWREGCWRFVVYPAVLASRRIEVVFAVHVAGRGGPVRVGMLDTGMDFTVPQQSTRPAEQAAQYPLGFSKLV